MAHHRRFRFGTGAYLAKSRAAYLELVHEIAALGYSILTQPDHFGDHLAPIGALMAAADAEPGLRVGATVFANDFRHPAVLAKEVATLDLLTDGRFECGIGAGYVEAEYQATGILFDAAGVRVSRMQEAITVLKGLWSDAPVNFSGTHYTIRDFHSYPKPVQQPHPPIMIAGGGRRILSIAAREADIVGLIMPSRGGGLALGDGTTATTVQQVAWVQEAAGQRWDDLELNTLLIDVRITNDRQQIAHELAPVYGVTPTLLLNSIHFLIGTVDEMVDQIQSWREQFGVSYITVIQEHFRTLAPVVARLAGR
jgi:probable F420-dependent oxidoreductase